MTAAVAPSVSTDSPWNFTFAEARLAQQRLEVWLTAENTKRCRADEVEAELAERGREVLRLLFQAHLQARGTGDAGPALRVWPDCEDPDPAAPQAAEIHVRDRHLHTRQLRTIFGTVVADRTAYSAPERASIHPLDKTAALPPCGFSYELQRRLALGTLQGPFDEAVADVREATGVKVPKRSAEQLARAAAVDFDAFYAQRIPPPAAETGPLLVAAVDCKGVPMVKPEQTLRVVRRGKGDKANKKRMATVAAVFTQEPRVRTPEAVVESLFDPKPKLRPRADRPPPPPPPGPEHKRVWASVAKGKDEVIAEVAAELKGRDPHGKKRPVLITDGERALQQRLPPALLAALGAAATLTVVLDFPHAGEKLWQAAYCFHPEGSDEAKAWVRERALKILRGQVRAVVAEIRRSAAGRPMSAAKRKTIVRVTGYLERNRDRMRYHEYLRDGLPIGSGSVEGACKNLVKDRMERSGMRWTIATAEAVLRLRAAAKSGDFEDYWDYHVRREQEHVHPPGHWSPVRK